MNQDGATSINNNKYLITYLIKEYGQMHFIQECIVNSQNVFNCVYVQADNLIQYEENLPFPPRFLLLQHLAVDVNALTRNVFTGFRLLLCSRLPIEFYILEADRVLTLVDDRYALVNHLSD